MSTETPFKIAVPDEAIALLKTKLEQTKFPDELEGAGQDYGVPLNDMQRLVAYWKGGYDWRKHEHQLNEELPQFARDIEVEGFGSINVHYVHKKSEVDSAVPLMFVHGWPGSFFEIRKLLPFLVMESKEHPSFHVVAISLPGFGFSQAPKKKGFAIAQHAETCHKLMLALGYKEYVAQGGDWGSVITHHMASTYGPKHLKAWHTNCPLAGPPTLWKSPMKYLKQLITSLTPSEKAGLERTQWYSEEGSGYFKEQATQPQTLGYSLADSPAGLLGWIYEKLVVWTDNYSWSDDEVLTWISIYWFSRAGAAASVRIYYEFQKSGGTLFGSDSPITIPTGYSYFPKEVVIPPRLWLKEKHVVFESEHQRGGHFAAYERPEALAGDLRRMFGQGGPAFAVVKTNNGYKG